MNLLFSTTSVVEKKSDILYNRSGVKNSIFWVKNQKRRGNSMRKKKLWKSIVRWEWQLYWHPAMQ